MSTSQQIASLASEPGVPIEARDLRVMETFFGTSLASVRLHFSQGSDAANRLLGTLAFTTAENIYFRSYVTSSPKEAFTSLLAHELTHVLQKRAGRARNVSLRSWRGETRLEREAAANSIALLSGALPVGISPDPSALPRSYGPAGHYYTAFYTAAAVGFSFQTAAAIALYTQLPDLVDELDAKAQGLLWPKEFAKTYLPAVESHLSIFKSDEEFWNNIIDSHIDNMLVEWQVQAGLHSLTGGDAQAETKRRANILNQYEPGTLEFGLAVHAYGDSFAHRDGNQMYGAPAGHAAEIITELLRGDFLVGEALHPTDPDKIFLRQEMYVSQYGQGLYETFLKKSPRQDKPPLNSNEYQARLAVVASWDSEEDQERILASDTFEILRLRIGYQPPDETVPWEIFRTQAAHIHLNPDVLSKSLTCAAEWCGSASPFHMSAHTDWQGLWNNVERRATTIDTGGNVVPLIENWDY